jgi:hypothetical protein
MIILSKTIMLTLIFLTSNIYSQDTLKWNFKYSGYVDLKTIKPHSGGQIINLFIMVLGRIVLKTKKKILLWNSRV